MNATRPRLTLIPPRTHFLLLAKLIAILFYGLQGSTLAQNLFVNAEYEDGSLAFVRFGRVATDTNPLPLQATLFREELRVFQDPAFPGVPFIRTSLSPLGTDTFKNPGEFQIVIDRGRTVGRLTRYILAVGDDFEIDDLAGIRQGSGGGTPIEPVANGPKGVIRKDATASLVWNRTKILQGNVLVDDGVRLIASNVLIDGALGSIRTTNGQITLNNSILLDVNLDLGPEFIIRDSEFRGCTVTGRGGSIEGLLDQNGAPSSIQLRLEQSDFLQITRARLERTPLTISTFDAAIGQTIDISHSLFNHLHIGGIQSTSQASLNIVLHDLDFTNGGDDFVLSPLLRLVGNTGSLPHPYTLRLDLQRIGRGTSTHPLLRDVPNQGRIFVQNPPRLEIIGLGRHDAPNDGTPLRSRRIISECTFRDVTLVETKGLTFEKCDVSIRDDVQTVTTPHALGIYGCTDLNLFENRIANSRLEPLIGVRFSHETPSTLFNGILQPNKDIDFKGNFIANFSIGMQLEKLLDAFIEDNHVEDSFLNQTSLYLGSNPFPSTSDQIEFVLIHNNFFGKADGSLQPNTANITWAAQRISPNLFGDTHPPGAFQGNFWNIFLDQNPPDTQDPIGIFDIPFVLHPPSGATDPAPLNGLDLDSDQDGSPDIVELGDGNGNGIPDRFSDRELTLLEVSPAKTTLVTSSGSFFHLGTTTALALPPNSPAELLLASPFLADIRYRFPLDAGGDFVQGSILRIQTFLPQNSPATTVYCIANNSYQAPDAGITFVGNGLIEFGVRDNGPTDLNDEIGVWEGTIGFAEEGPTDLEVTHLLVLPPGNLLSGQPFSQIVVVRNEDNSRAARDVQLTYSITSNDGQTLQDFVRSFTPDLGTATIEMAESPAGPVTLIRWKIGTLDPQQEARLRLELTKLGPALLEGSAFAETSTTESNPANNLLFFQFQVIGIIPTPNPLDDPATLSADLEIIRLLPHNASETPPTFASIPNQPFVQEWIVRNLGPFVATQVVLQQQSFSPDGITALDDIPNLQRNLLQIDQGNLLLAPQTARSTWFIGTLQPGEEARLTLQNTFPQILEIVDQLSLTSAQSDPNPENNLDEIKILIDADEDQDGVANAVEDFIPTSQNGQGDGNNDNLPDRSQPHIASFRTHDNQPLTLEGEPNTRFQNVQAIHPLTLPTPASTDLALPLGWITFDQIDLPQSGQTIITLLTSTQQRSLQGYLLHGPTPESPDNSFQEFPQNQSPGIRLQPTPIRLSLQDGELGDLDLAPNQRISHLGAPTHQGLLDLTLSQTEILNSLAPGQPIALLQVHDSRPEALHTLTLISGPGDQDNPHFQLINSQLHLINQDLTNDPPGSTYSLRLQVTATPFGDRLEKSFLLNLVADFDQDHLPDTLELTHATFLHQLSGSPDADADADGISDTTELLQFPQLNPLLSDTDGDTLLDGAELSGADRRPPTNPALKDTDGDGLHDGIETHTSQFLNLTHTGTHPLLTDSDADGLPDGSEVLALNPHQYVSNPNLKDTDGDGRDDASEIAAGTDPDNRFDPAPTSQVTAVALWTFDVDQNPQPDITQNGHDALVQGAVWTHDPERDSGVMNFMGNANSFLEIPHAPDLALTGNFTLAAWVYLESPNAALMSKTSSNRPAPFHWSTRASAVPPAPAFLDLALGNGFLNVGQTASQTIPLATWNHLALTYTGNQVQFYLNGEPSGAGPINVNRSDRGTPLLLGSGNFTHLQGRMDNVALFNLPLSDADVKRLMNGPLEEFANSIPFEILATEPVLLNTLLIAWGAPQGLLQRAEVSADLKTWIPLGEFITPSSGIASVKIPSPPTFVFIRIIGATP